MRVARMLVVVTVVALAGCGGAADEQAADGLETPAPSAGAPVPGLRVVIGTEADPEAFALSLEDASGKPVTSLPAGDHVFAVDDRSRKHNAHLTGEGVDERTSVPEQEDVTWSVTLAAGEYELVCDPHAQGMRVDLAVE